MSTFYGPVQNPAQLEVSVFSGGDGTFSLYEDDGESMDYQAGKFVHTRMQLSWGEESVFTIFPAEGDRSLIPSVRSYTLRFYGICPEDIAEVTLDGKALAYEAVFDSQRKILSLKAIAVNSASTLSVRFQPQVQLQKTRCSSCAMKPSTAPRSLLSQRKSFIV